MEAEALPAYEVLLGVGNARIRWWFGGGPEKGDKHGTLAYKLLYFRPTTATW